MASSVVVKVKYGDTLRRFNASVNENQQMELNIEALRAKIRSLFNFPADADLKLTYVDEDMDMVALVDEEDLRDVVKQGLNPVRITVQLNTGKRGSVTSSGTSTPVPPQGRNLNPNVNAGVADYLKSVPKPLREPLSKLSNEVASKAASASPVLADLIDSFTKAGQSFLNAHNAPQPSLADVAASKASGESQNEPRTVKDDLASGVFYDPVAQRETIRMQSLLQSLCDKKMKKKISKDQLKRKLRGSVDAKHEEGSSSSKGTTDCVGSKVEKNPLAYKNEDKNMKSSLECPFSGIPNLPYVVPPPPKGLVKSGISGSTEGAIFHRGVRCDGCGVLPITGPRFKSKVKEDYDLCHICFEQMGKDADYVRIDFPAPYRHPWSLKGHPMMRSRPWVHPPPPPFGRHMMKQIRPKLDSRFILDVNVMDGTIMAPKTPFTKIWRMRNNGDLPWTHGTQLLWIGGDKFSPTDSVEIEVPLAGFHPENEVDVAADFIAPESPGRYISYWKMASPSGQKFGQRIWVLIQVDASLSDVTSAVSNSLNLNLPPEGAGENNLPQSLDNGDEPLVNVEDEPTPVDPTIKIENPLSAEQQYKLPSFPDDLLYDPIALSASTSSVPPLPITSTISEPVPATQDLPSSVPSSYPTIEPNLFNSVSGPQDLSSSVPFPYPTVDSALFNSVPALSRPAVAPGEPSISKVEIPQQSEPNNDVEATLLKELEEMGFKQVDLNKEVLRKNDYNFEESLDELCNVSEWDLLLEELQGMGFADKEVNKRVLAKNNGSLKHAVMDLITRENA